MGSNEFSSVMSSLNNHNWQQWMAKCITTVLSVYSTVCSSELLVYFSYPNVFPSHEFGWFILQADAVYIYVVK